MPPGASLTVDGQTQLAGIGSYCWPNHIGSNPQTECQNVPGLYTSSEPLVVSDSASFTGHFHLDAQAPPDSVGLSVAPISPGDEIPSTDITRRLWRFGNGWGTDLPNESDAVYTFQPFVQGDGLYLVELDTLWKSSGSVDYGFLIQVGSGSSGLTSYLPTSAGVPVPTPATISLQTIFPVVRLGKGTAYSMALSPNGQLLAIGTILGVYVIETDTRNDVWFKNFPAAPSSLTFSPDGRRLAVQSTTNTVEVLEAGNGASVLTIQGQAEIRAVWSPDGTKLVTSADCQEVKVWDAISGALLKSIQEAQCNDVTTGAVNAAWSADGRQIYVNRGNGYVVAFDAASGQPLEVYQPNPPEFAAGYDLAPSPTSSILAVIDGTDVALLDGRSGKMVEVLKGDTSETPIENVSWSQDGKYLAAGSYGEMQVWELASGRHISTQGYHGSAGLAWMPDGRTILGMISAGGELEAVDSTTGKEIFTLDGFGTYSSYSTGPKWDGETLITPTAGEDQIRWDARTGQVIDRSPAPPPPAWAKQYSGDIGLLSPDGKRTVLLGTVYDPLTGQVLAHVPDRVQRDISAWSPDGLQIVSGDSLGTYSISIWEPQSGKTLQTLRNSGSREYLGALAWSPDGREIAGGGSQLSGGGTTLGLLVVWMAPTGKSIDLTTEAMPFDRIQSLAWSPDSQYLAAGTASGRIILWDMEKQIPIALLIGHKSEVTGFSWSPDGKQLASSSSDGTVLVWPRP